MYHCRRFTAKLSDTAKSLIAVDFMEKFVQKNKETNGSRKNVTIVCSDVMELEIPDNRLVVSIGVVRTQAKLQIRTDNV